jgi:hypothetical protein
VQYDSQTSELDFGKSRETSSLKGRLVAHYPVMAELQALWRSFKSAQYRRLSNPKLFRKIGATLP